MTPEPLPRELTRDAIAVSDDGARAVLRDHGGIVRREPDGKVRVLNGSPEQSDSAPGGGSTSWSRGEMS